MTTTFGKPVDENDRFLFQRYKAMLRSVHIFNNRIYRLFDECEFVWNGTYYFMVRQGPYENERKTYLVSKYYMMLRTAKHPNALMTLAVAGLHPVHKRACYKQTYLHTSNSNCLTTPEQFRRRRWSKSLRRELCEFAEAEDAQFEEVAARRERSHDRCHEWVNETFDSVGEIIGKPVYRSNGGTPEKYYANTDYRFDLFGTNSPRIRAVSDRKQISLKIGRVRLNDDEFNVLIQALGEVRRLRHERIEKEAAHGN